jgi:hypothetical protein
MEESGAESLRKKEVIERKRGGSEYHRNNSETGGDTRGEPPLLQPQNSAAHSTREGEIRGTIK